MLATGGAALCVNTAGVVGGYVGTHAALWQADGTLQDLGNFSGTGPEVVAVNDRGQAVISIAQHEQRTLVRWQGGQTTTLGQLPDSLYCGGNSLNTAGWIVGSCTIGDQYGEDTGELATLWTKDQAIDLNTLLVNGAGWTLVRTYAVNDLGLIVGHGELNGQGHRFLLVPTQLQHFPRPLRWLGLPLGE